MNPITLIGQLSTRRGDYQTTDRAGQAHPGQLAAADYLDEQPPVPFLLEHDPDIELGEVRYLERSQRLGLVAVARLRGDAFDDEQLDRTWYLSPSFTATRVGPVRGTAAKLDEISLVREPGSIGLLPVRFSRSDVRFGGGAPRGLPVSWYPVWDRAIEAMQRPRTRALRIVEPELDELLARRRVAASAPSRSAPPRRGLTRSEAAALAAERGASGFAFDDDIDGRVRVAGVRGEVTGLR